MGIAMKKCGLVLLLLLNGCSAGYYHQGVKLGQEGMHQEAIELFYAEIKDRPDNGDAWRELGIQFYQLKDYGRAEEALAQAGRIRPDARVQLYLGLVYEQYEEFDRALVAYRQAVLLQPDGATEKIIRAHIRDLVEKRMQKEIDQALANEKDLDTAAIPANTIAVVDFDAEGLPADLAPIGRGLVEFTALDLGKVHSLQVVERGKIGLLLAELDLNRSGLTDAQTRLRVGRLVGSRHLVSGSLGLAGEDELEIFGAVGSTVDSAVLHPEPAVGSVDQFFALQKDLVFGIIGSLGITLTLEERDAIEAVPTESFLAFMAYCRGLEAEANGDPGKAAGYYGQAVAADAGFASARSRKRDAESTEKYGNAATGGSFEETVLSSLAESYEQQNFLVNLVESSQFLPSDIPDVGLGNADPDIPEVAASGGVSVIVRGRINDSP